MYDGKRCIHARHCVLGQPKVFKANVVGPWIDPDAASAEALVTVAHMCPSGAIAYRRMDGGPEEAPPPVNLIQLRFPMMSSAMLGACHEACSLLPGDP